MLFRSLQRLLALKRHEQPVPQYFDGFLNEFHRRLAAADAQPSFWQKFLRTPDMPLVGSWRMGLAGACGVALTMGLLWMGLRSSNDALTASGDPHIGSLVVYAEPPPAPAPLFTLPVETGIASTAPSIDTLAGGLRLASTGAARPEPSQPRYVLDRIPITPASYEVRADF